MCLLSPLLFNIVLEGLARAIRWEKEMKSIYIRKEEVKWHLCSQISLSHLENPKNHIHTQLELINSVVAGYKINIQKSVVFLYTNNEISEREIKETVPFIVASER